jgi:hypothetical protein
MNDQACNCQKISKIETDVAEMKLQLSQISDKLTILTNASAKLNNHIDFVEHTYDTLKTPLNYLKDTVNRITFRPQLTFKSS